MSCEDEFYESINLKAVPVKPFRRMSQSSALEIETKGGAYYIKRICKSEGILSIIHRQDRKDYAIFTYFYEDGKLAKYKFINSKGEVREGDL